MTRPTFESFKQKALADPEFRAEYEATRPEFEIKNMLIGIRMQAGLSLEQLAERMGRDEDSVGEIERIGSGIPRLSDIVAYAEAAGYELQVRYALQIDDEESSEASRQDCLAVAFAKTDSPEKSPVARSLQPAGE